MSADWHERFERFAANRIARASAAELYPYVTEVEAPPVGAAAIGNAWSHRLFDGMFYLSPPRGPARASCSLVFVQSADGNTGTEDPSSLGGGETDTHLIYEGLSRAAADAVLAGASTVRGSDVAFSVWHPELVRLRRALGLPRHPAQIVATAHGLDLDAAMLFNVPDLTVLILTNPSAAHRMRPMLDARPWIRLLMLDRPDDLSSAFDRLGSLGIARVSCVGGRTLARALLDGGLVDDVYLTTAPRKGGEADTPISPQPWRGRIVVRKHGTGAESGVVFEHVLSARAPACR